MKELKMAKFQVLGTIPTVSVYYALFLSFIAFLVLMSVNPNAGFTSSGLEMSSAVFIFIVGLNSFKESFKFSQANNISRKTFFKGVIMGMIPITLSMSIIDLIINRFYNIFVHCPTNFDMIYGSFRDTGMRYAGSNVVAWTQANDFSTLFGTITWQFAVYSSFFLLGILISLIYYRSNKLLKVLVSVVPVILITLLNIAFRMIPTPIRNGILNFISAAFGWQSRNPYMAVLSFIVLASIFACFGYLLIKKAVAKE